MRQWGQVKKEKGLQHFPSPSHCSQPAVEPMDKPGAQQITAGDTGGLKGMTHSRLQGKPVGKIAVLLTGVGNFGEAAQACPLKCHLMRNDTKVGF